MTERLEVEHDILFSMLRTALASLILFVTLIAVPGEVAYAAKKKTEPVASVSSTLTDATVNLYCRFTLGKKYFSTSGSGVFIDPRGVILTNAHVAQYFLVPTEKSLVKGWCSVRTGSPAKDAYTASVLYFPSAWAAENIIGTTRDTQKGTGENDFALLYVTGAKKGTLPTTFPYLPFETAAPTVGTDVTILGYPTENLEFDQIRSKLIRAVASSTVTKLSNFTGGKSDMVTLAASSASASGISGGPIVNPTGKVMAIATSKSTSKSDTTLRAITLTYIQRLLQGSTGLSLSALLLSDFGARNALTVSALPTDTLKTLTNRFLKQR